MRPYYLVITPFFPSNNDFRGAYIYDQVKAIKKLSNFEIILLKIVPYWSKETNYEYQGVKCFIFKCLDFPSFFLPGLFNNFNSRKLLNKLKEYNIDLDKIKFIHAHITNPQGLLTVEIKKKLSSVMILQHHGLDVFQLTNGRFNKFKLHDAYVIKQARKVCNNVDIMIGVSERVLLELHNFNVQTKQEYVLYNGVDLNKFFPIVGQKSKDTFIIGCVANFWEIKDQMTLIKAVEKLIKNGFKNIKVIFIGSGATMSECKHYICTNKLSYFFEFRSEVDHTQMNVFYNSLHLFVLPSYYEAMGCVYLEAYAAGVPFIAVKGQGISEFIPEEEVSDYLIEQKDADNLSVLIKKQMESPHKSMELKHPYSIDNLINNYLNMLDNYKKNHEKQS